MKILCLGDIYGSPGQNAVLDFVSKNKNKFDFILVNGENSAAGFGITPRIADDLFIAGVDVISTGNHIWAKREIYEYIDRNPRLIRPANYPESAPGKGMVKFTTKKGENIIVINLQGNVFMPPVDSPFFKADALLEEAKEYSDNIIVDFHAEATSEKYALAHYLDGRISLLFGTHTHVQTNDAQILEKGTGYCTDIGMCGSIAGVIGVRKDIILEKYITGMPQKFLPAEGKVFLHGLVVEIEQGKSKKISLLKLGEDYEDTDF